MPAGIPNSDPPAGMGAGGGGGAENPLADPRPGRRQSSHIFDVERRQPLANAISQAIVR